MRRFLTASATALAVFTVTLPVHASQPPAGDTPPAEDEGELVLEDEDEMNTAPAQDAAGGDQPADQSFLDEEGEGTASEVGVPGEGDGEDGDAPNKLSEEDKRKLEEKDITVVQQQPFLNVYYEVDERTGERKKRTRFELMPVVGLSVNDAFVRHWSAGAEANLWLTNRMAIGLSGNGFFGTKTPAYDRIRAQAGLLLTANRYLWQGSVHYIYEPFYGKIAVFNRAIMHWEGYVQVGGGAIHTRTIPRFETLHDPFDNITGQVNLAMGGRFYVRNLDFMSFNLGVKTWGFFDLLEPPNRGVDTTPDANMVSIDDPRLSDPKNAKKEAKEAPLMDRLAWNVVFFLGVSFYLPSAFEYSTRR